MNRLAAPILLAAAAAGAIWLLLRNRQEVLNPPPVTNSPAPPSPRQQTPVSPAPVAATRPTDAAPKAEHQLELPDGSKVAALNGVTNPPRLVWQNPEWSPIIGVEHHGNIDWYKHADGSFSTTMWTFRSDLGRNDAVSFALHPLAPAPTAPLTEEPPPVRRQ